MFIVKDNFLSDKNLINLTYSYFNNGDVFPIKWVEKNNIGKTEELFINTAKTLYQFTDYEGVEIWTHHNTLAEPHKDKDEELFNRTGKEKFPLCSIVFYFQVENLIGGELECMDVIVRPKTNRLVIFSPGLLHSVNNFTGTRILLAINPWKTKPEGYN